MKKLRAGILGATGMVGQRLVHSLANHPWFEVSAVAASPQSAGKTYGEAVSMRGFLPETIIDTDNENEIVLRRKETQVPQAVATMKVYDVVADVDAICEQVDFVFCALDMFRQKILEIEEICVLNETPVISNNSANRETRDVPVVIPEINPHHLEVIPFQRKRIGVDRGFIVAKPNCSLQSYVPALHPILDLKPLEVFVCTYQALSGAGKTFHSWPGAIDNIIPFIRDEEYKSVTEPAKIWGTLRDGEIHDAIYPDISVQCIRVPVSDGHLAAVFVRFDERTPEEDEIIARWKQFEGLPQKLRLPSAPIPFLRYFDQNDRPQTRLDRMEGDGMAISLGRLRMDSILLMHKFVALSHNTIRGAAGGAILIAELLKAQGYLVSK